ncbi:hypothetical protein GCM10010217_76710 [Streptomyces tubercidicus]
MHLQYIKVNVYSTSGALKKKNRIFYVENTPKNVLQNVYFAKPINVPMQKL